jgi:hypothetical protein
MAVGLTDRIWTVADIVARMDADLPSMRIVAEMGHCLLGFSCLTHPTFRRTVWCWHAPVGNNVTS